MGKHDDAVALAATAHLPLGEGYRQYRELSGTRNLTGYEVARRRIDAAIDPIRLPDREPDRGPVRDYVGLNQAFFDIETTFSNEPVVLYAALIDHFGRVQEFRKGDDWTDDRELVRAYANALSAYDVVYSWNGKLFDVPVLNSRLSYWAGVDGQGPRRLDLQMHVDLMYYATGQFNRLGRKSLQNVSEYFSVSDQKTPLRIRQWNGAMAGKAEDYEKIATHCIADVKVLRQVLPHLKMHVRNIHRAG